MVRSDGLEYVITGGGDPRFCGDGEEGMEEYDVAADDWEIKPNYNYRDKFNADKSGPSITVRTIVSRDLLQVRLIRYAKVNLYSMFLN